VTSSVDVTNSNIELPVGPVMAATAGSERQVLESMLEYYRAALERKTVGVSEDDLRRRFVPSQTTLGGLLRHLGTVERRWFQGALAGRAELLSRDGASSSELGPDDTITTLLAEYEQACAESREVAAELDLGDSRPDQNYGQVSLRFVYVHMIDETARHAGHADIIRELIDGSTGDR
jgi:uncharacterized protein DUF664